MEQLKVKKKKKICTVRVYVIMNREPNEWNKSKIHNRKKNTGN